MSRSDIRSAVALGSLVIAASGLLAICTSVDPGFVVDEVSGVTIVENYRPAWGERSAWTVDVEPKMTIPQWSPPESRDSFHLTDAKRLPGGRLVVADGYAGELGLFDTRGELVRRVGGDGTEFGRFRSLRAVHVMDDELWAFDGIGRWNVFDLEGALLATLYLEPKGGGWSQVEPYGDELAVLSLAASRSPRSTESGFVRPPFAILRYERTGAAIDTLATVPGPERYHHVGDRSQMVTVSGFSPFPVLHGGRRLLYAGAGERMEIDVYDESAKRVRVIRIADLDLSIAEEDWEAEAGRIADMVRRHQERRPAGSPGRTVDVPRRNTRAAYSRFLEDSEENLWVADHNPEYTHLHWPPPDRWTVFDPDGRWLGSVETPAGLAITEIGEDYVLGIARVDERSVVRLHELAR